MRRATAIAALLLASAGIALPTSATAQDCASIGRPAPGTATLNTSAGTLQLDPSQTASVDVDLELTSFPYPVDVFFLLEASSSMKPLMDSLRDSIDEAATDAANRNLDLYAGVASFADYPRYMYRLDRQLGPVDCSFRSSIPTDAEGKVEPHLIALMQAATGAGLEHPTDPIPPGLQARFRKPGLSLVVHATNERVHEQGEEDGPPPQFSPTFDEVISAYRSRGILHAGINVIDSLRGTRPGQGTIDDTDPAGTRASLQRLARGTGALAPTPIDCNGDGAATEIRTGDPVVCDFDAGVGGAVIDFGTMVSELADALRPDSQIQISVLDAAGLEVSVTGGSTTADLADDGLRLAGTTGVTCPSDAARSVHPVEIGGLIDGVTVATSTVTVTCGQPVAAPVAAPPAVAPPSAPAPAPAPPPPPVPAAGSVTVTVPNAASATVTNAVPASASQVAPGVMVVPDEVQEYTFAAEHADRPRDLAFSRRRSPAAPTVVWIAGAMLLTAMTYATRREQVRTAPVDGRSTR